MIKETTITLIREDPAAHGVFEDVPSRTERQVCCSERSLSLSLVSQAKASGLNPSLRITLQNEFTYKGETLARYHGQMYKIVQSYPSEKYNQIDLLLERVEGNADV